jgi:hypothetical protein
MSRRAWLPWPSNPDADGSHEAGEMSCTSGRSLRRARMNSSAMHLEAPPIQAAFCSSFALHDHTTCTLPDFFAEFTHRRLSLSVIGSRLATIVQLLQSCANPLLHTSDFPKLQQSWRRAPRALPTMFPTRTSCARLSSGRTASILQQCRLFTATVPKLTLHAGKSGTTPSTSATSPKTRRTSSDAFTSSTSQVVVSRPSSWSCTLSFSFPSPCSISSCVDSTQWRMT